MHVRCVIRAGEGQESFQWKGSWASHCSGEGFLLETETNGEGAV